MIKNVIVGAVAIIAFAAACILVIELTTHPARPAARSAPPAAPVSPEAAGTAIDLEALSRRPAAPPPLLAPGGRFTDPEEDGATPPEQGKPAARGEHYSRHGRSSEDR